MKRCIIVVFGVLIAFGAWSQEDRCKSILREAIHKMKSGNGKSYRMKYVMTTVYDGEEGTERYAAETEVIVSGDKSVVTSNDLDIYKDANTLLSINKEEKIIYISNAVANDWKKVQAEAFAILHDSLLNKFQVRSCETSCPDKRDAHFIDRVEIQLPEGYIRYVGIQSMSYWIDRSSKQITRCLISYVNHPMGVRSIDFVINEYDSDFNGGAYDGTALAKVMGKNNKVFARYKDFEIKDIRK